MDVRYPAWRGAVRDRLHGLALGLTNVPDRRGWGESLVLTLLLAAVAAPLALAGGLVVPTPGPDSATLRTLVVPFLAPGLVEECLFRGLLLPHPRIGAPSHAWRVRWWIGSLVAYVAAHPLVAAVFRPSARGVFDAPLFLLEAALLGITATALVQRTGSLWPAVLVHGAVVAAWLQFGGAASLGL